MSDDNDELRDFLRYAICCNTEMQNAIMHIADRCFSREDAIKLFHEGRQMFVDSFDEDATCIDLSPQEKERLN